jgi:hypothetical protein
MANPLLDQRTCMRNDLGSGTKKKKSLRTDPLAKIKQKIGDPVGTAEIFDNGVPTEVASNLDPDPIVEDKLKSLKRLSILAVFPGNKDAMSIHPGNPDTLPPMKSIRNDRERVFPAETLDRHLRKDQGRKGHGEEISARIILFFPFLRW